MNYSIISYSEGDSIGLVVFGKDIKVVAVREDELVVGLVSDLLN